MKMNLTTSVKRQRRADSTSSSVSTARPKIDDDVASIESSVKRYN